MLFTATLLSLQLLGAPVPGTAPPRPALDLPPPTGMEASIIAEARAGKPLPVPLLDAALLAGGTTTAELPALSRRIRTVVDAVRTRARRHADPRARGAALLEGLHDTLLRTYAEDATDLAGVLETGRFNCVSSAVLYVVAAEDLLDAPRAMVSAFHAFARVTVEGQPVDVEATLREGFAPDRARIFTPEVQRRLGFDLGTGAPADVVAVAARAVELPAVALVAAIYSNRAVDLLRAGQEHAAAVALDRAAALARGEQKSRITTWRAALLNNAALRLLDEQRPVQAVDLLRLALRDPPPPDVARRVRGNLSVALTRVADTDLGAGDAASALVRAQEATELAPDAPAPRQRLAMAQAALARQEADTARCNTLEDKAARADCVARASGGMLEAGKVDDAVAAARVSFSLDGAGHNPAAALFNALQRRGHAHAVAGRCSAAAADFRDAEALPIKGKGGTGWKERAAACWFNVAVGHSRAQKDPEAAAALEEAARLQPGDARVKKALAQACSNVAVPLVNTGRCDEARPWLARAARHDATDEAAARRRDLLAACALRLATTASAAGKHAEAAAHARRGLLDAPDHPDLRTTLGIALYNVARGHVLAGQCNAALPHILEARDLGAPADGILAMLERCPSP